MIYKLRTFTWAVCLAAAVISDGRALAQETRDFGWNRVPTIAMGGGLTAYWDVRDSSNGETAQQAYAHGFAPVTLINPYVDYPGGQRESIYRAVGTRYANPWRKPPFFEKIIRRNIQQNPAKGIYVQDIEFPFEEDATRAWENDEIRRDSGATPQAEFEEAYFRQWAEWFWLPLLWTKSYYPGARVGLYGPQPFRRDYWGITGKDATQIDGTHKTDWRLWKYIDPYVDFYTASIYIFYDDPGSVFYMAANVEENYLRTRSLGDRPVYAYTWLRFHDSNRSLKGKELPTYLVEAMAIVPYFSGAKGVVLWGYEPRVKTIKQQPYAQLPHFVGSLKRIAALSDKIGRGRLLIDQSAHEAWTAGAPLIRRIMTGEDECVVMAIDPWQGENEWSTRPVRCGGVNSQITVEGRRTTLAVLSKRGIQIY